MRKKKCYYDGTIYLKLDYWVRCVYVISYKKDFPAISTIILHKLMFVVEIYSRLAQHVNITLENGVCFVCLCRVNKYFFFHCMKSIVCRYIFFMCYMVSIVMLWNCNTSHNIYITYLQKIKKKNCGKIFQRKKWNYILIHIYILVVVIS